MITIDEEHDGYTCGLAVRTKEPKTRSDRENTANWCGSAVRAVVAHLLTNVVDQTLKNTKITVLFEDVFLDGFNPMTKISVVAHTSKGELYEQKEVHERASNSELKTYKMTIWSEAPIVGGDSFNAD